MSSAAVRVRTWVLGVVVLVGVGAFGVAGGVERWRFGAEVRGTEVRLGRSGSGHARTRAVASRRAAPTGSTTLGALPLATRLGIEQAMAASNPMYAPRIDEGGPVVESQGSLVARFSAEGARVSIGVRDVTLRAASIRRGSARAPGRALSSNAGPTISGTEVRTDRGAGVLEWWRSLPSGLEHGVTIADRLAGDGELVIDVAVSGELTARSANDDAIDFVDATGARVATYAHLVVLDAAGMAMPARMAVRDGRIAISIEDARARYPIVVDPLLYVLDEATLLPANGAAGDNFGHSVALSSDGSRALVGARLDDTAAGVNAGSAHVLVRTGTSWSEEATLLAPDGAANDNFGYSVALSSDGSRALVGAYGDTTVGGIAAGSVRVFARSGTSWSEEATLLASGGAASDYFGYSVALTSDGSRALVGDIWDDTPGGTNAGSARVFLRTGTSWVEEATLLAVGGVGSDNFGCSVALSSDGSRALVGAFLDDTVGGGDTGSARVFLRTGTSWVEEATLLAVGGAGSDYFGYSVALSSDGSRALVGAYWDTTAAGSRSGSARVFLRTGTSWTEEATLLASNGASGDYFGYSVALSSDGSRALVGAYSDDTPGGADAGSARVFVRSGTSWSEEATLLASGGAANDQFGFSAALSSDGSHALVGVNWDDTAGGADAGSACVFVRTGSSWAEGATLFASGGEAGDVFGTAVALSSDGSRALVGAVYDDTVGGGNAGSARVFLRTGTSWTEEATLLASLGAANDYFGTAVALSSDGSRALVGAYLDDTVDGTDTGSARVFLRTGTTWTEEATLLASLGAANDYFGTAVALSSDGTRALVGASGDDTVGGANAGSARVFVRTGTSWVEEATLLAVGGAGSDYFGYSVALSSDGSRALVGAYWDTTAAGSRSGSARVFLRTGTSWTEEATLLASNVAAGDLFGSSVALSSDGTRALVGASLDDTAGGVDAGTTHVFVRTGTSWAEEATLLASDGAADDRFGTSVALSSDGSRALVGAYGNTTVGGIGAGSAQMFVRTGTSWVEEPPMFASDGAWYDGFGSSVALSSDATRALIGVSSDDTPGGVNAGSARVLSFVPAVSDGTSCSVGGMCLTGHCIDGVCCDSACGADVPNPAGTTDDCLACSVAAGAVADGTCATIAVNLTHVCRAAVDGCDLPEVCDGLSTACPANAFVPYDPNPVSPVRTECRAKTPGVNCDAAEYCDGNGGCPTDVAAPSNTTCRPMAGPCDTVEVCDGTSASCPGDAYSTGGYCRIVQGPCDLPDVCNGTGAQCPTDFKRPPTYRCGTSGNVCDLDDYCDGTTDACANSILDDGIPCNDALTCTQAETCQLGVCAASLTVDCSDTNPCTSDMCSEPMSCTHMPIPGCTVQDGGIVIVLDAGTDGGDSPPAREASGCGCRVVASKHDSSRAGLIAALFAATLASRRARRRST